MKRKLLILAISFMMCGTTAFASETEMDYDSLKEKYDSLLVEYDALQDKYEDALERIIELEKEEEVPEYDIVAIVNEVNEDSFKVTTEKGNVYVFCRTNEELNVGEKVQFAYRGDISSSDEVQEGKVLDLVVLESAPAGAEYETGLTYDDLSRNPDENEEKLVKFRGTVVQLIEDIDSDIIEIRFAVNDDYEQILYCGYDKSIVESRVLEGDWITIYGSSLGLLSYESTFGGMITIPAVYIDIIEQ